MKCNQIAKISGTLLLSLTMALFPVISVHAYSAPNQSTDGTEYAKKMDPRPLNYLCEGKKDDQNPGNLIYKYKQGTAENLIKDDYWIDLQKANIDWYSTPGTDLDDKGEETVETAKKEGEYFGVFPKYLPLPSATKVDNFQKFDDQLDSFQPFSNSGICMNGHSENFAENFVDGSSLKTAGLKYTEPPKNNPDSWEKKDILTENEVNDPDNQLVARGDMYKTGDKQHSQNVGEYQPGDSIKLSLSLDLSWFKRYMNASDYFWLSSWTTPKEVENGYNQTKVVADSGLAFTLDLPKDVTVSTDSLKATLSGLDGFSVQPVQTVKNQDGTQTLVIHVQKDNVKVEPWKDLRSNRNKVDTSNIDLAVDGLKVASDAADGNQVQIRGTEAGYYDFAIPSKENSSQDADGNDTSPSYRSYFFFAAKQGDEGRDAALPSDGSKNNMISYSFKVSKPVTPVTPVEDHTVTFHPANGQSDFTQTVADGNKVSQPAEPVQDGYTFNGWYTNSALTNKYDFDTPVTSDLDLYAKWTKNPPAPNPETNKVTGILLPEVIASGSSKQTLTWTPLTNVDGYYVYEAYCNTYKHVHPFKKVADVSASSSRVYKRSGLKKGAAYKYYVAGYKIKNGKKQVVKKSVTVHSAAGNLLKTKNVKYTNVKSVSVKKNAVTLKVGKTYRIQPSAKGVYSGYAILQKGHAAMFRYLYIKDGKNIKVSQNGTVKALKTGKCNVYVLGTNGVRAKVAVTVK